jgi:hypothetical protein
MQERMSMRRKALKIVAMGITTISLAWNTPVQAANEAEVAEHLIELMNIGREVVSENQATINDAAKADKGFTADFVADQVIERFKKKTNIDLRTSNVAPQANFYYLALVEAEREVVDEAQPVINRQGIGFKGFLHAEFAHRVGEHFYQKTGVRMKLTGISGRNLKSKPDDFEQEVLRMFRDPRHPKGQSYARNTTFDGRPVLRMIDPEYAESSCLSCHGEPKGERDIMGMKKEGWKKGDFAGAISLVVPLR